jgi:acyl-CoA synthetase (AMP-forming)/AMP-acid ligase II
VTSSVIDAGDGLALTVPQLIRDRARDRGDAIFLAYDDVHLSYTEADRRSATLARGLIAIGAGKGTHVGVLQPNGSAFVIAWLAAARIGAITIPLSTFSTSAELLTLIKNADIEILLSAESYRAHDYVDALTTAIADLDPADSSRLFSTTAPALRHIAFSTVALGAAGTAVGEDVLTAAENDVTAADPMVIVHTSGSTSEPKGVIHTHGALIRHLANLNEIRRYSPNDVLFSNSPFFWIGGFAYVLLGTLVAGARAVCSNATTAAGVLDVLECERPNMVNGFAQSIAHLADDQTFPSRDLSSIRRGNLYPIMPADVRPADPGLRHAMLGMTEAGSVCLVCADETEQPEHRRGSFGRPAPGFETLVVDIDHGTVCEADQVGELWLRGPFMMEGYYGRERCEVFDADGWYHTGDLVSVDRDGFFYFTSRRGDMIKTSGANVSPREVEQAIRDVVGLTAHVVGIDDSARGQVVVAAIVTSDRASVDVEQLESRLAARLSAYKRPRRFVVLAEDEVPIMSSGKLDARALKALLA